MSFVNKSTWQPPINYISLEIVQLIITNKQMQYLIGPNPPRARQFHLLPKIHKDPQTWILPGHPIVSDCGSESYNSAEFIDYFLNPLYQLHDSYLKDKYDWISERKSHTFPAHFHDWQSLVFTQTLTSNLVSRQSKRSSSNTRIPKTPHPLWNKLYTEWLSL